MQNFQEKGKRMAWAILPQGLGIALLWVLYQPLSLQTGVLFLPFWVQFLLAGAVAMFQGIACYLQNGKGMFLFSISMELLLAYALFLQQQYFAAFVLACALFFWQARGMKNERNGKWAVLLQLPSLLLFGYWVVILYEIAMING